MAVSTFELSRFPLVAVGESGKIEEARNEIPPHGRLFRDRKLTILDHELHIRPITTRSWVTRVSSTWVQKKFLHYDS